MANVKEVKDAMLNAWIDAIEKPDGVLLVAINQAVENAQQKNVERISELEKMVKNLESSPSPYNTYVPESLGPVDDGAINTGFM